MPREIALFKRNSPKYLISNIIRGRNNKKYIVEGFLGSGGNAVVYKCYDEYSGDEFAVKFLINDKGARKTRFERETSCLKTCAHHHIIEHIDDGRVSSQWKKSKGRAYNKNIEFIVMELSDNGDLRNYLNEQGPIEPEIYTAQFRGLCDALEHMHGKEVLHRDIKPENILIIGDRWVLSDFGIAATPKKSNQPDITGDKEKVGPMFWMSPEATNKSLGLKSVYSKINKSSDIFQLASVFWYIVNKRHPSGILCSKDWRGNKGIYEVIKKALQHNPKERYLDGAMFKSALVDAIEQNP